MTPLESLIATGTKLWLDSIDPDLVVANRQFGATGATSNPIIVGDLIKTGRFGKFLACSNYPKCKNTKKMMVNGEGKLEVAQDEVSSEVCDKCGEKTYAPEIARALHNYARNQYRPTKTVAMPVFDFAEQGKQ